jgi:AraC-like DNA-binding protein
MLQVMPPPSDLKPWLDGVVSVQAPAGLAGSWFPALPHAMLTVRVRGRVRDARDLQRLLPAATFHTMSTVPTSFRHEGAVQAIGLLVRPEAGACLLGASTGVLTDRVLPWALLTGEAEAARLEDEVQSADGMARRVEALLGSFRRAVGSAVHAARRAELALLCHAVASAGKGACLGLGIGERQLERRFLASLGVSPKMFQRLTRLHATLGAAVNGEAAGAELALQAGYYDQSHLARDLRQLAGAPLRELLAQARPDAPGWALASGRQLRAFSDGGSPLPVPVPAFVLR